MSEFHFDEIIQVLKIDQQVVYDKVTRIHAKIEDEDFILELDVHSGLYPMKPDEVYRMVISNTLLADGSPVRSHFTEGLEKSLADKFEYVMHGLVYKMSEEVIDTKEMSKEEVKKAKDAPKDVCVYISFGGLQLMLKGDPLKMHKFEPGQKLFLLLRKI